eukprot:1192161-Prorocentrum_minimum.AAC.1
MNAPPGTRGSIHAPLKHANRRSRFTPQSLAISSLFAFRLSVKSQPFRLSSSKGRREKRGRYTCTHESRSLLSA